MNTMMKYYKGSALFALLGMMGGYALAGIDGLVIVAVLSVLETSLSFDNAVVNATVLKDMDDKWRQRFLVWGMLIAVFGMRLFFPLLIVSILTGLDMLPSLFNQGAMLLNGLGANIEYTGLFAPKDSVLQMAISNPELYAKTLTSAHHEIAAFGGAFLMMVFVKFFVDANKDEHWLHVIEAPLTKLGRLEAVEVALTLGTLLGCAAYLDDIHHQAQFVTAGVLGIITYIFADGIGALLGGEHGEGGAAVAKQGFAGFMYLELLDASFSFDGVIGAFALSNNLFIIAIGLGVGAMFVRSMTLMLVDKGTLASYRYLEHGAFWAIGALAALMFAGVHMEVPEAVTGLLGAALIGLSFWSSVRASRKA